MSDIFEQSNCLIDARRKQVERIMSQNPGFFNETVMEYLKEYDRNFRQHLEEFACAYLLHTTLYPDQVEMVVEESYPSFGTFSDDYRLRYKIYFRPKDRR